jgi:hypothetical protein
MEDGGSVGRFQFVNLWNACFTLGEVDRLKLVIESFALPLGEWTVVDVSNDM